MRYDQARPARAAHLLLLAALLLYVGSVAVEPLVHGAGLPSAADLAAPEPVPGDEAPAGEHDCAACKLTRTFVAPTASVVPASPPARANTAVASVVLSVRGSPEHSPLQARAPPLT
jgi:hypothetical protein